MKLLYITNGINGSGGLERVLSVKASFLAERFGYEVSILVLNGAHENAFYKFSPKIRFFSIEVKRKLGYLKNYAGRLRNLVKDINPDIISVCDDGLKGFFVPKILPKKYKIIYERHASIDFHGGGFKNNLMKKLMLSQVSAFDKFVVLTNSNLLEWNPEFSKNLVAIPNPLSFESLEKSRLNSKIAIAVGSHSYNKGYDLLLEMWKNIEEKNPDWQLHIYGKADPAQTFPKLAQNLDLKNVHFFAPVPDIREKYLGASFLVLPSRSEGFGMVLTEAMECGLPCISFDCPSGPRDIISDKEDGFLIPLGDKILFENAVQTLISDEVLRKKMGAKAAENVKRFSAEEILTKWDKLFLNLKK